MTDPIAWRTETLRASFFCSASPVPTRDASRWWASVAGVEEPQIINKASPEEGQWIGTVSPGALGSSTLHLRINSGGARVDWMAIPASPPPGETVFATIGQYHPCSADFARRIAGWRFGSDLRIARVAFGAVLLYRPEDPGMLMSTLDDLLPNVQVERDHLDFLYQVNRPRNSRAAPLSKINRLTKWSIASLNEVQIQLSTGATMSRIQGETVIRLELDINTRFEGGIDTLAGSDPLDVFTELVQLADEIAMKGGAS